MPIPDAAGRQWFINMAKYFTSNTSDTNIGKHAKALNIKDPRDLVGCIETTTSSTARQVIRLLYSADELLTMKGTSIPASQRVAIREFAESQRGPISNHQFNEAINGVFRSKKNEFKKQQQSTSKSTSNDSNGTSAELMNKGQKTLTQMLKKGKASRPVHEVSDKENSNVDEEEEEEEPDNE